MLHQFAVNHKLKKKYGAKPSYENTMKARFAIGASENMILLFLISSTINRKITALFESVQDFLIKLDMKPFL
jgi:hypothetical protein